MNPINSVSPELPATPSVAENSGIPSVNRTHGLSKNTTYIGFGVIFIAGLFYILSAVNGKPPAPANSGKTATKEEFTDMAALVKPVQPQAPASAVSLGSGNLSTGTSATASTVPNIAAGPLNVSPIGLQGGRNAPVPVPVAVAAVKPVAGWIDRKMEGVLLLSGDKSGSASSARPATAVLTPMMASPESTPFKPTASSTPKDKDRSEVASLLGDRNFLITKGTSLDCALETALDSTLPGITTCRTTRDVYSDNGQVLLLDRGTQLVGEYQGGMKQGQARVYVLWTRAKTPNGVIISLNSPGIDPLGRSGFDGYVDNHFMERFGAAILMSFMKDSVGLLANKSSGGTGTTNLYGNSAAGGEKVIEKILDASANIPPTLMKNQGEHIQVMVAKDLDFSTVYGLQAKPKIM